MSQQETGFVIILFVIIIGKNHMAHLHLVTELFEIHKHGLTKNDILRKDRQNWASGQKLTFLRV